MSESREYLGDLVYVECDDLGIVLALNNGEYDYNTIYLEYDVIFALLSYLEKNGITLKERRV